MPRKLGRSFKYAFRGIFFVFSTQRNFVIHLSVTAIVVLVGAAIRLNKTEWLGLITVIGLVLVAETINTALESLVDLTSPAKHELAEKAKDSAAAAVLISSICAIIVGVLIFGTRLLRIF